MRKQRIFTSLIIALLLLMVFSNPGKNSYVQWVNDKAHWSDEHPTARMMEQLVLPKNVLEKTQQYNLGICSIYQTAGQGENVMTTLGVFNHYIVLHHIY